MHKLKLFILLTAAIEATAFTPTPMQFGCRDIPAYETADAAKGYGAQQVFLESGCLYLKGVDLVIDKAARGYLKVCNRHNHDECYWTPDTRP